MRAIFVIVIAAKCCIRGLAGVVFRQPKVEIADQSLMAAYL